jgi:hypothetical protein
VGNEENGYPDPNKTMINIMENLRKKEPNRNPGNKKVPLVKQKHSGKPLQQTTTNGKQNIRAQR